MESTKYLMLSQDDLHRIVHHLKIASETHWDVAEHAREMGLPDIAVQFYNESEDARELEHMIRDNLSTI